MDFSEYTAKLAEINKKAELDKEQLTKDYCMEHNPYQIGDIITDHSGSIVIEHIYVKNPLFRYNQPQCIYGGIILNNDGQPNKRGKKRNVWQENVKKHERR